MKTIGVSTVIFLLFFTGPAFSQEQKFTAAVMDLEAKEGVSPGVASMLSDYLRIQLVNTQKFIIVTRENMEQVLREQQFQLSGCTSQECIMQLGQLLGVRKIFTGSIGKIGATYLINLKIIDVESGEIERAETEECAKCKESALVISTKDIANKITGAPAIIAKEPEKKDHKELFPQESAPKPVPAEGEVKNLGGRFGIGINYSGAQIRYGISNSLLVEGVYAFASNNNIVGTRLYCVFAKIPGTITLLLYTGPGFDWILSPYLTSGYEAGGFIGAEALVANHIGLGGDVALYYVDVWSLLGGINDISLIFNLCITYYF